MPDPTAIMTDEQVAAEVRDLFALAEKYEGMKSAVQWAIADRLLRHFKPPKPITDGFAFQVDKDVQYLRGLRRTAERWPAEQRQASLSFDAHRSLNKREDRFARAQGLSGKTLDEVRKAENLAPATSESRSQAAETDTVSRAVDTPELIHKSPEVAGGVAVEAISEQPEAADEVVSDPVSNDAVLNAQIRKHTPAAGHEDEEELPPVGVRRDVYDVAQWLLARRRDLLKRSEQLMNVGSLSEQETALLLNSLEPLNEAAQGLREYLTADTDDALRRILAEG